jgi:succinate dehydrogenase / fumarate reductase iron-sulfur subunit
VGNLYKLTIFRYDPESNKTSTSKYEVEVTESHWTLLDVFRYIKNNLDDTLTFRYSCGQGICGSCAVTVNGRSILACETQMKFLDSFDLVIEPLRGFPVIRDLVVDHSLLDEKVRAVMPWLVCKKDPESDKERFQSVENRAKLDGLYECIVCGSCIAACPTFWKNKTFLGPQSLLYACRFMLDSRDEGKNERFETLADKDGIYGCHTIFNCMEVCPKELNPGKAILELRKMFMNEES